MTNTEAFKSDIRPSTDVLVLYDMESEISDRAKQHFQNFADAPAFTASNYLRHAGVSHNGRDL